jgi:hypothetical protein
MAHRLCQSLPPRYCFRRRQSLGMDFGRCCRCQSCPGLRHHSLSPVVPPHVSLPTLRTFVLKHFQSEPKRKSLSLNNLDAHCAYRKLHPAVSRQMSHCYFPVAFLTQAPVPFRMSLISMAFVADGICGMHRLLVDERGFEPPASSLRTVGKIS